MGVSGCGKTSIGQALCAATGIPFFDGDDFMPAEQINKMASGIPLGDEDRQPWLEALHQLISDHLQKNQSLIVASSALKRQYRQTLSKGLEGVRFIYLKGTFDVIFERMNKRSSHFMKAEMLRSQFDTLEEPQYAVEINIEKSVPEIVQEIIAVLNFH